MKKDLLGRIITAEVIDENDRYIYSQLEGQTFQTAKKELKKLPKMGSQLSGFAYENDHHHLQLTKNTPKVGLGRYSWGTVVSVQRDLGVFVDIGLPNKDIVVSLDDLPELRQLWPQKNDRLMIGLKLDNKGRLWGDLASESMFQGISQKAKNNLQNQDVTCVVYRLKKVGTRVLTKDYCLGFIHPSQRMEEPRLGQVLQARVIGVSAEGTLNLSLKPRAFEAIGDDAQMILAALQHSSGSLNFSDKSTPQEINDYFGISKGQFKRALGHLLKAGAVNQKDGKIYLNE
ncbi:S1 RNA-binding protein [Ligilactobacillus salitolerans]|uniref:S1 RNA-binding protein n=1 Tax=Ligilactobacillus salitolerans TaxID=1808352 RepID=A0A401ITK2_9LACO|nr:S1-like domain-containing RNA-binding protein [Ligilactobacillus salitolerans]GBG94849.1 S1 RNA-binding protein [Ligilactobacillus salitolerans]